MSRRTPIIGPAPRRSTPPEQEYTAARHLFLAGVRAGYFALRFSYGAAPSSLILTDAGQKVLSRYHVTRGEQAAHRWATGKHSLLSRDAGFHADQLYSLYTHARAVLDAWNTEHGNPLDSTT
jgi:hypothetical protein